MDLMITPRRAVPSSCAAALLGILSSATAAASPIDYTYSGVITSSGASTAVIPGTAFSGTFTYDPDTNAIGGAGFNETELVVGSTTYGFSGTQTTSPTNGTAGLSLQIGGQTIVSNLNGLTVNVMNDELPGYVQSSAYVGSFAGSNASPIVGLELSNPTEAVLGMSGSLPLSLSQVNLPVATLTVTDSNGDTLYAGTIETFAQVPEPAYTSLLCIATAACFARSRQRHAMP